MRFRHIINFVMTFLLVFSCTPAYPVQTGREERECWDNGNTRACRKYYETGDLAEVSYYRKDGSLEQLEKYDKYGNKVQESYYASNGKLRENADGWAAMRCKYKDGKMVEESYFSDNGRLKEHKQYNELGDLVAKQYVGDITPDASEEFNPQPVLGKETITYYDSGGGLEGETEVIRE